MYELVLHLITILWQPHITVITELQTKSKKQKKICIESIIRVNHFVVVQLGSSCACALVSLNNNRFSFQLFSFQSLWIFMMMIIVLFGFGWILQWLSEVCWSVGWLVLPSSNPAHQWSVFIYMCMCVRLNWFASFRLMYKMHLLDIKQLQIYICNHSNQQCQVNVVLVHLFVCLSVCLSVHLSCIFCFKISFVYYFFLLLFKLIAHVKFYDRHLFKRKLKME